VVNARCLTAQSRKRLFFVGLRLQSNRSGSGDCDGSADGSGSSGASGSSGPAAADTFVFPFIPDLGLRVDDILQSDAELETNSSCPGVSAAAYRLTDAQMKKLRLHSKSWSPGKLAWGSTVAGTLTSHYGNAVAKGTDSQLVPCSCVTSLFDPIARLAGPRRVHRTIFSVLLLFNTCVPMLGCFAHL
jgi:hypothetical protein